MALSFKKVKLSKLSVKNVKKNDIFTINSVTIVTENLRIKILKLR